MHQDSATHSERSQVWLHLLGLAAFSAAVYLPSLGRGFIVDDFVWLFDAAYRPASWGLSHPAGGLFYSPLGLLTFQIDWKLWGFWAFPLAIENLLLHIANSFLLYGLALRLWRSAVAAWWAAFGFAILFPANIWAVMWIATRAHLLAAFFYLVALHATIWYFRTQRNGALAAVTTVALAAAAVLSKETGVTLIAAIPVLVWYEQRSSNLHVPWRKLVPLLAALAAVLAVYFVLRARSGALPIATANPYYHYQLSVEVLVENFLRYAWRTYGLQALLAGALAIPLYFRGIRPSFRGLTRDEVALSVLLFAIAIAPVVLIEIRSGIYPYLPAIGASLLLGAVARSMHSARPPGRYPTPVPVLVLVAIYASFTVGQSAKWKYMAQTDTQVLRQIAAQLPGPPHGAVIVLRYAKRDDRRRFPDSFASWGFSPALQLLYGDPTVSGAILLDGEAAPSRAGQFAVDFTYQDEPAAPKVVKMGPDVP